MRIIDRKNIKSITNIDALARGTGCRYMLVIDSPYPGEFAAVKWLRKLPASIKPCYAVIDYLPDQNK